MANETISKKMDIASRINGIAQEFRELINTEFVEFSTYFGEKIEENVISLLNVDKPKIMVYGIYNSGKSTLINSLCKEEVAEMADRPMTDQITEYDRGDYYLVDSPGVDAPIQHEMVTEEHINKCHIILYVISSKGLFEDRTNYEKLANLIKKDIPFVMVLNDRGSPIGKDWTEEQKKRAKFDHNQDLKLIQYKIIDNLVKVSNDPKIAEKYEVVILNAKMAWMGITKGKPKLYDVSGIDFLDKRINQLLTNESAIGSVFKQPIINLKECLNEVVQMITKTMSGNSSEDFAMRLHTLERKKDNIREDLKILTLQAVNSRLDELTKSYVNGDADVFETVANSIFMDIEDRYTAKINEMLVFVERNFKDLNLFIDSMSNLSFDASGKKGSQLADNEEDESSFDDVDIPKEKTGFFDFLKSRSRREKEKQERLEREAKIRNEREQYRVQENIRRKQEARQLASSDLDVLYREFNAIVNQGLDEKYDDLITQIQQIDCLNKQVKADGERQMEKVIKIRNLLGILENEIG